MIASYYSRRSTLLAVSSIALILLISIGLLYHGNTNEASRPIFQNDHGRLSGQLKEDSESAAAKTPEKESYNPEPSAGSSPDETTWAKPSLSKTSSSTASAQTTSLSGSTGLSVSEIQEMCDHETQQQQKSWRFDPARDSANYGLEDEQCESAFPELYHEINRAQKWRFENHGNITEEDLDLGWKEVGVLRAMIYERQVCWYRQCIRGQ